jgi:chromosome segregation ATPase
MNTDGLSNGGPPVKKRAKPTFPKERLYQLQKNYRERKKEKMKKLEEDLAAATAQIETEKAALSVAKDEICQLKTQLASFRMDCEATKFELARTCDVLNLLRRTNRGSGISYPCKPV